jgi:HD-GYP domain-containing protein (c-di-GMP phosphodiesterase class II)
MTTRTTSHAGPGPLRDAFVQRCSALGVPCLVFDGSAVGLATPGLDGPAGAWLRSPLLLTRVRALHQSGAGDLAGELFPGCRVVRLDAGGAAADQLLALVIDQLATLDPLFEAVAAGAGLGPDAARQAMAPWIQHGERAGERIVAALRWLRDDSSAGREQAGLLDEFGNRLMQVYEESHVLFRIMRLMASSGSVREQVQAVCSQIHQIFPFGWMCIAFRDIRAVEPRLRGQFVVAGTPACGLDPLVDQIVALIDTTPAGGSSVLDPGAHALATLVAAEVICEPIAHDGTVIGVLLAGNKLGPDPCVASPEIQFLSAAADFIGTFHENAMRFTEQRVMYLATVGALTATIDAKDPYTRGHSERVAHLTEQIALAMGHTQEQAARAHIAGMVHDIGKIGVPDAVLCKNGRLTDEEFAAIKRHPEIGHRILKDIEPLADILPGVLHHHERWDGRGYPHGLAGEDIALVARMIGLADAFDAMSSNRSYRAGMSRDHVIRELTKGSGTQFDPQIVNAFMRIDLSTYDAMVKDQPPPTIIEARAA